MISKIEQFLFRHGYILGAIFIISAGIFGYYQGYKPFGPDDLWALSQGAKTNPSAFFSASLEDYLPMYRPITYLTVWLQYQIVGINPDPYYLTNIFIYIGCVLVLYFTVYDITSSRFSSAIASIFLLVDIRASTALFWIGERQSTLALFFGSMAILLCLKALKKNEVRSFTIIIYVLLLLSALSKEFGLSFAGILVVTSLSSAPPRKKQANMIIAVLVMISYVVLRFGIAESFLNPDYCETTGYRDSTINFCQNDYDPNIRAKFFLWNIGSTFVGVFFPELFSGEGQWIGINLWNEGNINPEIYLSAANLFFSLFMIYLVYISFKTNPRKSLPFLALIVFTSSLNFLYYRPRNQLMALYGLYILLGMGLYSLWIIVRQNQVKRIIYLVVLIIICVIICIKVIELSQHLDTIVNSYSFLDPCVVASEWHHPQVIDMEVIKQLKKYYKMSNPECLQSGWKTWHLKNLETIKD